MLSLVRNAPWENLGLFSGNCEKLYPSGTRNVISWVPISLYGLSNLSLRLLKIKKWLKKILSAWRNAPLQNLAMFSGNCENSAFLKLEVWIFCYRFYFMDSWLVFQSDKNEKSDWKKCCQYGELLLGKISRCFRGTVKNSAFPELEVWNLGYKYYSMNSWLLLQAY